MSSEKRFDIRQLTKAQLIYRDAWRNAYLNGSATWTFESASVANRFKMGMYGERKKIGAAAIDETLGQAMINCEITTPKEGQVTIRVREDGPMMRVILEGMGKTVEEIVQEHETRMAAPGQAVISASQAKLLSMLDMEEDGPVEEEMPRAAEYQPNPYYVREK